MTTGDSKVDWLEKARGKTIMVNWGLLKVVMRATRTCWIKQ
jgi:hypothetical protein